MNTGKQEKGDDFWFLPSDYEDSNLFSVPSYNFAFYLMSSTDYAKSTMSKMTRTASASVCLLGSKVFAVNHGLVDLFFSVGNVVFTGYGRKEMDASTATRFAHRILSQALLIAR